ncbi:MAG: hypothetical protein H6835_01255 [Planctomycetes bacterium]|nr:hypothetical protein [Planctomycetota bacterium]
MKPISLSALVTTLFLCPLAGAQTYVVDAQGGPGSNFTDLPAAIAAVPDGAVLLVRAGNYSSFTIQQKGLTVLGDPGVTFGDVTAGSIEVRDLTASQRVFVRGFDGHGASTFLCSDCAGPVVFDHVSDTLGGDVHMEVSSCSQLMIVGCSILGRQSESALTATDSDVVAVGCTLRGGGQLFVRAAVWCYGGRLQLTDTAITGGTSSFGVGGHALRLVGGEARIDGASALVAGSGPSPATLGYAVSGTGTLRVDPGVTLYGKALGIEATIASTTLDLPALHGEGGQLGGTAQATLSGAASQLGVVALGLPGAPISSGGDEQWITTPVVITFGVLSGPVAAAFAIPTQPNLRGATLGWQGAALDGSGALTLSNPVWFAVH